MQPIVLRPDEGEKLTVGPASLLVKAGAAEQMDARAVYDGIADDVVAQNPDVSLGQMIGMPALERGGKMIGGFWRDHAVPPAHADRWPKPAQHAVSAPT